MEALDKQFGITDAGSTVEAEIRAGITTFLTMAYILLVNPSMLAGTGIGFDNALFATAIAAFVGCTVMGLWANLPFALAPGMGLNAYFTFAVVGAMGVAWEVALAAVFVEGIIFMIISLPQIGWRTEMINSIPTDLKIATGAGIGMFLALIGLEETGIVVNNGVTLVDLGAHASWTHQSGELLALVGLIAMAGMMARGMNGAIIYGIAGMSIVAWAMGSMDMPVSDPYNALGNADMVVVYSNDVITSTPHWGCEWWNGPDATSGVLTTWADGTEVCLYAATDVSVIVNAAAGWGSDTVAAPALGDILTTDALTATGAVGAAISDGFGAIGSGEGQTSIGDFILIMIAFMFVDIFDTAGTLYSVGRAAGYVDENDELQNSDEAFMSDAAATIVGALVGTSTTTTYIESAAGVEEGGKTGLTAVTVGVLMLSGLFLSGLFQAIPQFAMATALVVVGALMMKQVADIDWGNSEIAVPAFLTMVLMPFTFSIADGIAWGIISYVAIQIIVGKAKDVNVVMWTLFALMSMFYLGPGEHTTFEWIVDLVGL
ncbi:NCS2 family permease [Candidatus Poseidoniales archaeon]|nr:NCS2 family permease [Candidatus Poseidoniales archaeon]MDC0149487.1 NCS2 family permease [Candidatus Poseidoniales archaeon]